ncbi:MAG TPA: hypothetical protein PLI45_04045 [Candidatus Woesebacteria bacterium]|nr:hypothetical protein [Candidatus Woesebacteria bacterium]
MKKKLKEKNKCDKILRLAQPDEELEDKTVAGAWSSEMAITGNMNLGKNGNPVTILVEDEVTGEQLELSGVKNAFLIIEDTRRTTSGWLAAAIGSVEKMGEVLGFLSQTTLETLKKLVNRD